MFFILSKTVSKLFFPLPLLFILGCITFYFRKKKWAKKTGIALACMLYLVTLEGPAGFFMHHLEYPRVEVSELQETYDVAIVLTGMVDLSHSKDNYTEYGSAVDRILAGIDMVKSGRAKKLLITGGTGSLTNQDIKEAPYLKNLALDFGIEEVDIIIEPNSRNTRENALFTSKIIQEQNFSKLLLITSSAHMRRSLGCFKKCGLSPDAFPVDFNCQNKWFSLNPIPSEFALARNRNTQKEVMGIVAYWLAGYL